MKSTLIDRISHVGPDLVSVPSSLAQAARTQGPALRALCATAFLLISALVASAASKPSSGSASVTSSLSPGGGSIVVEAHGTPAPVPLFFSALVEQTIALAPAAITGEWIVSVHVVQGRPEILTLGLFGDGDVISVTGPALRDWSVRQTGRARYLDLRPVLPDGDAPGPRNFQFLVRTHVAKPAIPGVASLLIVQPGDAVGFSSTVKLKPDVALDLRIANVTGLAPIGFNHTTATPLEFQSTSGGGLDVRLQPRGTAFAEAELIGAQLTGRVNAAAHAVEFRLRGQLRAQKAGARVHLLTGNAALNDQTAGDGWHVELVALEEFVYDLVADREGMIALDLSFAAGLQENGDWRGIEFRMPAGAIVPLRLEGLDTAVEFSAKAPVVPKSDGAGAWQGFLPADGTASLAWKQTRESGEETLSFTSYELAELRVGAGLLRQASQIQFRVLQGKLPAVSLELSGPGEILAVEGANVIGWQVVASGDARRLEVRLSRPFETEGTLIVRSQAALGTFPVRPEPLRLTPAGSVRHSGFVRVANSGAVRLEVADLEGMMQLAPAQFPGAAMEAGVRQTFVYRFPSASYSYRVVANQIQPEVGVAQITTYELGETDRVINADLELDVREAPLRDWTLLVPADYAVVAVAGTEVADYVAESDATDGYRTLKIRFRRAIDGRQLVRLRLEKNQAATAGEWSLPALRYPGAKSVRGHVGAVSAPGYRFVPIVTERLVEVPLNYFPKQMTGLQQTWRLREPEWTVTLNIEALGQSVQADVFHLYSLKEGVAHGSVLLNYFVVGAPASEWRIEVPESVGNIDVTGQNVRRDWRREGNQVIVSLHQPVLGSATLLITFEQPMSARGGVLQPGEIRPLNVQAERGFIQVVSPLQVKHNVRVADGGLLRLEALELPAEFRLLTSSPSLATYQYTARPFTFELGVEWYAPGEMVDQVVDFAKLSSQVSREGQVVTDARFFVKTRGRKALRMVLPEGMKLWEARVDGTIVNAHADGEQTLVPLPPRLNPNEPVEVALRLGQLPVGGGDHVALTAPRLMVPVVINEWTLRGDPERLLVPTGGNAELVRPVLTETGFEWISQRARTGLALVFGLLILGVMLIRAGSGWRLSVGLVACAIASFAALVLAVQSMVERNVNLTELTYTATIVPVGDPVTLEVANLVAWRAMTSWTGVGAAIAGCVLILTALLRSRVRPVGPDLVSEPSTPAGAARTQGPALHPAAARTQGPALHPAAARTQGPALQAINRLLLPLGLALFGGGLLAQHGGAALFFAATGSAIALTIVTLGALKWRRDRHEPPPSEEEITPTTPGPVAGTVAMFVVAGTLALGGLGIAPETRADDDVPSEPSGTAKSAQSIVQTWSIHNDRLFAELDITVRGGAGDSFLLLRAPAILTSFRGDGLRVTKLVQDGDYVYRAIMDRAGTLTAHVTYELAVPTLTEGLPVRTGPAATNRVTIELDQGGWEFASDRAMLVLTTPGLPDTRSGATLVLAPEVDQMISLQPRSRDVATEATQFFAEVANLYLPGPGVVNGYARVTVRPTQGRVTELTLIVPEGFSVGEVTRGPVSSWRFDPVRRRLFVAIEPAQTAAFSFDVETQLGTSALPVDLTLSPLRVTNTAGEVGMIALAFGGDAQPESIRPEDLSVVNVGDFDAGLLPRNREGQPIAVLQHAWRYGSGTGRVAFKVAPVAPEVRVTSRQLFSLGDDRLLVKLDLNVAITRVGLFKLSFPLPEGLEVEALSGAALSQWTEATEEGTRIITLHLNGRTIGDQTFNITLAGPAPAAQAAWSVPRVLVREATRQVGEVLLVPEKGIRLRAVDRENATQLDPRAAGGMQPGTLAFRLLQEDWALRIGIEALEPWVTVQGLQDVTMREGQTLTRIALRYRVDNASVKQLRVRLPGLTADQVRTVRGTGSAVSDFVQVAGETDLWEIRFQRGIAGETDVQIEFQGQAERQENRDAVATPEFINTRQTTLFVAVRAGGRLELDGGVAPRGWQRVDWAAVPANLQDRGDRTVPALAYRVAEPEAPLSVTVRRHEVADALKLRVTQANLATIFSPTGAFLTAVQLRVDVLEKSTLRVRLPAGAQLFNTFVNGQSLNVVREGDEYLFHVSPNTESDSSASVRLIYAVTAPAGGRIVLVGPSLSVPLENVSWRVVVPPGHDLSSYAGGLRLEGGSYAGWYGVEQYQSSIISKRSEDTKKATALLEQANSLLQKGDQERASEVLSQVSNYNGVLDEASNEDARVQLRALKEQQAMLGLNTRRQRMYLGNRADAARNEQLEQAAGINPIMQGKLNFDPSTVDQLLMGNTVEENTALRGIAARIVAQQLDAEPPPGAIDIALPERGRVVTFTRSLQVDGTAPLELNLEIERFDRTSPWFSAGLLLALAGLGALVLPRRRLE